MKKDYQKWHKKKTYIENDRPRVFFEEREVWFCYVGENIGFEQDGRGDEFLRSVAILSQVRLIDAKRLKYKIGNVKIINFKELKNKIRQLLV